MGRAPALLAQDGRVGRGGAAPGLPRAPVGVGGGAPGREPWYLLTSEPCQTVEEAWVVVLADARRWPIAQSWRYGKSELSLERVRVWGGETRRKLLLLTRVAYAFLWRLRAEELAGFRIWMLEFVK